MQKSLGIVTHELVKTGAIASCRARNRTQTADPSKEKGAAFSPPGTSQARTTRQPLYRHPPQPS